MRLEILAVGRLKAGPERELYDRYSKRVSKSGRSLHLDGPHLFEITESKMPDSISRKADESRQLVAKSGIESRIIVLDERGMDFSSHEMAELIRFEQENGTSKLAYAIGGPDGHGDEIRERSFKSIRFGSMTWPHQLARVMLLEQVYRAITILSGHPYHRA